MPRNYIEDFENVLQDSSDMPSWKDFNCFLTQRFKTLESVCNVQASISKVAEIYRKHTSLTYKISDFSPVIDHRDPPKRHVNAVKRLII